MEEGDSKSDFATPFAETSAHECKKLTGQSPCLPSAKTFQLALLDDGEAV
jgi:hypothetical protein